MHIYNVGLSFTLSNDIRDHYESREFRRAHLRGTKIHWKTKKNAKQKNIVTTLKLI